MSDEELGQGVDSTSEGGSDSTAQDRQPEEGQEGGVDLGNVDLDQLPQFRKWKSETDKRLQAAEREAQRYREQMSQYEQQMHEARMAQMSAEERAQYEWQRQQEELHRQRQQLEWERQNVGFVMQVMELGKKYDVPIEVLDGSTSITDAYDRVVQYQLENPPKRRRKSSGTSSQDNDDDEGENSQPPASRPGNKVDTGQGKRTSTADALRKRYQEAQQNYDADAIMQIHTEAAERGIEL